MKKISLIIILGVSFLFGCERKLPYDRDGIIKGVVLDIRKTPFSTYLLNENSTDGTYSVDLAMPRLQGDFSFMREALVMCLYVPASNPDAVQYVEAAGPIAASEFEYETALSVPIDFPALCARLGIAAPALSDQMIFTTDVTLNNGTLLPGWTSQTGYTNSTFSRWRMEDGSSLQYNIGYGAYSPFDPLVFQGAGIPVATTGYGSTDDGRAGVVIMTDSPDASLIPYGFTADDFHCRHIVIDDGWFGVELDITLWLNEADYTLLVPDQTVHPGIDYDLGVGVQPLLFSNGRGTIDTTNRTITIIANVTYVNYGTWVGIAFVLTFP